MTPSAGPPDFLHRLLERSADPASVIEPRLPSLFEPGPWTSVGEEAEREPETSYNETIEPRTAPAMASVLSARQSGRESDEGTDLRPRVAQQVAQLPKNVAPDVSRTANREPALTPETFRSVTTERIVQQQPAPLLRLSRPDADTPQRRSDLRDAVTESAVKHEIKSNAPRETDTAFEPTSLRHAPQERVIAEPSGVFAAIAASVARSESSRVATPAPVVNVTIGRLEVRAQQATRGAKHSAATTAGAQPMSLGEYLQQRGKAK